MESLQREKEMLQRLVKAREAVKHKYNLLRNEKFDVEKSLNETFKPITAPLKELVNRTQTSFQDVKNAAQSNNKSKKFISFQPRTLFHSDDSDLEDQPMGESTLNTPHLKHEDSTPFVSASNEDTTVIRAATLTPNKGDSSMSSIPKNFKIPTPVYQTTHQIDKLTGIRRQGGDIMFGGSKIDMDPDWYILEGRKYPKTEGLEELVSGLHPNNKLITQEDIKNYRSMVKHSHLIYKDYDPRKSIKKIASNKFQNIILPLMGKKKSGAGLLPRYKIVKSSKDYVYWDDPNELVERLRLLIAERSAGNNNHENEILSIKEELHEAGYIY